jgi:hypothetical protein
VAPPPAAERPVGEPAEGEEQRTSGPTTPQQVERVHEREHVIETVERETQRVVAQPPPDPAPREPAPVQVAPPTAGDPVQEPAPSAPVQAEPPSTSATVPVLVRPPERPPLPAASPTPPAPPPPVPPRLEIGTIEVRLDEPAPAIPAPPPASTSTREASAGFGEYAATRSYAR